MAVRVTLLEKSTKTVHAMLAWKQAERARQRRTPGDILLPARPHLLKTP